MLRRGARIRWRSDGPRGRGRWREGVVRARLWPGDSALAHMPASADVMKLRAHDVNSVHTRYLVEVPRVNKRSGRRLASHWLAPKASVLERRAREMG